MDKIKLLLDEDVHSKLCSILKNRGFDVVHTQEVKRKGKSDMEQLSYACRHHRCIMSFNVKDFVLLHNRYIKERKEHWGIIVSKQLPFDETFGRMLSVLQNNSKTSMKNQILFLSKQGRR